MTADFASLVPMQSRRRSAQAKRKEIWTHSAGTRSTRVQDFLTEKSSCSVFCTEAYAGHVWPRPNSRCLSAQLMRCDEMPAAHSLRESVACNPLSVSLPLPWPESPSVPLPSAVFLLCPRASTVLYGRKDTWPPKPS